MEKLSNYEKVVRIIIESRISEQVFLNAKNSKVVEFLYQTLERNIFIPHDFIAKFVYETKIVDSEEDDEKLNNNISLLLKYYQGSNKKKDVLESNLTKIRNSYKLSIIQKEFIEKTIIEVEKDTQEISKTLTKLYDVTTKLEENVNKVGTEVESVKETKSSIYTDFISILGVFSAFVFLMFGGIDVVRGVIDVADDLQIIPLSRLIILGSLMLIAVLTLLYCLLLWIARITGKTFGECHKSDCKDGCKHKWRHFYFRHSFYFSIISVLILIIIVMYKARLYFR